MAPSRVCHVFVLLKSRRKPGADPEISERGAGSQILERGGWNATFQCRFQSFCYKSLTNIPPKGGGRGPSGPSPKSAPVNGVSLSSPRASQ